MENPTKSIRKENLNPSEVSEPSLEAVGSIFRSGAQRSSRASERTDAPAGAQTEIRDTEFYLRQKAAALRAELAGLCDTPMARHVEARKRQRKAAILAMLEKRLRDIRQMRLF